MNRNYPVKLWLTTNILAPILGLIYNSIYSGMKIEFEDFKLSLIFISVGLFLSLPVFIICIFSYKILIQKTRSALIIKMILILVSIVEIFITFFLISGSISFELSLFYSASVLISGTLYKIRNKRNLT